MNILFVADPLESFKVYKDTTFSMMRAAQKRGHRIAACEPRGMLCVGGVPVTRTTGSAWTRPILKDGTWHSRTLTPS